MEDFIKNHIGSSIIFAGAGTGKTKAIVDKVLYLIKNNLYSAEKIVCLTFSNEATRSMEAKIINAIELELKTIDKMPTIKTFHALCADLIREYGKEIGINEDFMILQPEDAMIMLHKNLKINANLCDSFISSINTAKDLGITLDEYEIFLENEKKYLPLKIEEELEILQFKLRTMYIDKSNKKEKQEIMEKIDELSSFIKRKKFFNAWKAYEKLKIKKNYQDYSDLNSNAIKILEKNPDIAKKWEYVIVDEFQDTNKIQLALLNLLAPHKNITVVGDINQSIYRFRGAYKDNLETFKKIFSTKEDNIYNLTKSYRSPNTILRTANNIIKNNYLNKKECFEIINANNIEGDKIKVFELINAKEEVRKIIEIIKYEIKNKIKPEEICVIFRTHQQANLLKRALENEKIEYHSTTKKPLLKHPIIKNVMNYISIINSLGNNVCAANAWWDLINESNFEKDDQIKLSEFIKENKNSQDISHKMFKDIKKDDLSENGKKVYSAILSKINLINQISNKPLPDLIEYIYKILDIEELEKTKYGRESILALDEFKKIIKNKFNYEFFDIPGLIHYLDIIRNLGIELEIPAIEERGIKVMTAHSTKGLEYDVVIIANMVQKKFPIEKTNFKPLIPPELIPEISKEVKSAQKYLKDDIIKEYEKEQQLNEERRLCYVAFTRTKKRLYITYSKEYGQKIHAPSQFLFEAQYKDNPDISFEIDNKEIFQDNLQSFIINKNNVSIKKEISFSPSALKLFTECQKKYEYKYVLNMPEEKPTSWETIKLGSFVHKIIERGVKENFSNERSFQIFAREESLKPEWEGLDINEALLLLKVFFERNKNKYNEKSLCEKYLQIRIDGIDFCGIADRIDFNEDGIEIIDYKTGYMPVPPKERNWQLGIYAIAAAKMGKVKRVTLDMLRHDKPLEFDINENGIAIERNTKKMSFNLNDVKKELVETANLILDAYKKGFKPCPIEKNCEFCEECARKKNFFEPTFYFLETNK